MTAAELAGLRPGDRVNEHSHPPVYAVHPDGPGYVLNRCFQPAGEPLSPGWHRSPADAWAVAAADTRTRLAAVEAEARKAGVVVGEPGRPTDAQVVALLSELDGLFCDTRRLSRRTIPFDLSGEFTAAGIRAVRRHMEGWTRG